MAGGHGGLIRGKAGPQAIRAGADDYRIEAVIQVQQTQTKVICDSRRTGRIVVPFVYYSSWRRLPCRALGVTAGKKGKRPARTEENRLLNIKQHFVNVKAHEPMKPIALNRISARRGDPRC